MVPPRCAFVRHRAQSRLEWASSGVTGAISHSPLFCSCLVPFRSRGVRLPGRARDARGVGGLPAALRQDARGRGSAPGPLHHRLCEGRAVPQVKRCLGKSSDAYIVERVVSCCCVGRRNGPLELAILGGSLTCTRREKKREGSPGRISAHAETGKRSVAGNLTVQGAASHLRMRRPARIAS